MDQRGANQGVEPQAQSGNEANEAYEGYATLGEDTVIESSSPAIPSPDRPAEARLTPPQPEIQSIGETPGDANPALAETIGYTRGEVSTADLLRAREAPEEQGLRQADAEIYETQSGGAQTADYPVHDSDRPNWPLREKEPPIEYMDAPRADEPLGTGNPSEYGSDMKGLIDRQIDEASTQAAAQESHSGLAPTGWDAEEDKYEQREFGHPGPPSDLNVIAPSMPNLPTEDNNG